MRRRLGQHMLRDRSVAEYMAGLVPEGSVVLEVGAGTGTLTLELAKRASKVYAIELDRALAAYLSARAPPNVEVIVGDALRLEWPPADFFASNIPYYISSPLLLRLAERRMPAVVMLQREVAERISAEPGSENYGRLTVAVRCNYDVEVLRTVPPRAFSPPPQVYSAVVRLTPRPPCVDDFKSFEKFTAMLFSQRRKLARKLCRGAPEGKRVYQLSLDEVVELFGRCRS
ncbi:dimethyladenosine transferase [Thermoproteus uzoniensis 768-20]|uniref:Probable ribosomal RNA small subunit methyltransferase A n=1 Tax=Thermoproteus uzoniensis (strain 768-20) TaxID=999630 RepID=F2L4D5_THEU7|nr:16S rRNA (adenine(1518)-N(6)/adenine(1519)-N(6))-dimethyltransferase RsmA [Thermoproteus uzoniensis]AEA13367.1 dimethyladenosine transferase [Thermoproteus uzoniensis 768-20]